MLKTRIVDALAMVDSDNYFVQEPAHIHCNISDTYYLWNGGSWVAYLMVAGLDYYELGAKGISEASDGSTAVTANDITLVY